MLWAKDDFRNVVHVEDSPSAERSWHVIHTSVGPLLLAVCYRPPDADDSFLPTLFAEWRELASNVIGTILLGDFNIHHKKWLRFSARNSVEGERFQSWCRANNIKQLVAAPTREAYLLDLVLTDLATACKTRVCPKIADHSLVYTTVALHAPRVAPVRRLVWLLKKADWAG